MSYISSIQLLKQSVGLQGDWPITIEKIPASDFWNITVTVRDARTAEICNAVGGPTKLIVKQPNRLNPSRYRIIHPWITNGVVAWEVHDSQIPKALRKKRFHKYPQDV